MRSLQPEQILLLLLFVVVPLLNVLVRWLQRRVRERQRPVPPPEPRAPTPEEWPRAPMPPRVRMIEPVLPRQEPRETRPVPRPLPAVRRAGPLGGRAAVRRAIVAMTILGPCRGLEEPAPVRPPSQPASP